MKLKIHPTPIRLPNGVHREKPLCTRKTKILEGEGVKNETNS